MNPIDISICISTYKRESLKNTIDSLINQNTNYDYEIIIIDNDKNGFAKDIVNKIEHDRVIIKYYIEEEKGLAHARNKSVIMSQGKWLAFIDDDEVAKIDWIENLMNAAKQFNADVIMGTALAQYPNHTKSWIKDGDFFSKVCLTTGSEIRTASTCNVLVKKKMLPSQTTPFCIDFNTTGGEDTYMFKKMFDAGAKGVTCSEAIVYETIVDERLNEEYLMMKGRRVGETYYKIYISSLPKKIKTIKLFNAFIKMIAFFTISMAYKNNKIKSIYWKIRAISNLGKLSSAFTQTQVELYK